TFGGGLTFTELVFKVLQTPLQAFAGSLPGGIILTLLIGILFWCGIHGPNIVGGVMTPIWTAAALANQSVLNSGQPLVVGENAEILTIQVFDVFIKLGGCGLTLGLLIAALLSARSAQLKSITRLSIVPGIFNINEPVIFGLPIAFNAYFLVPFLIVPVVALIICYFAIVTGFLPPFNGVQVPWTTPPIISGFLLAGVQGVIVQIVILISAIVIYFPFVKKHDHMCLRQEEKGKKDIDDEDLETLAAGL
ncbi:MAG: PTS transporter subunit EIIC, partial [Erysipelotrichaceae bacterium]|nr:PTS transporter subunit EIIC [Erysipelotrichaceae bacterium]